MQKIDDKTCEEIRLMSEAKMQTRSIASILGLGESTVNAVRRYGCTLEGYLEGIRQHRGTSCTAEIPVPLSEYEPYYSMLETIMKNQDIILHRMDLLKDAVDGLRETRVRTNIFNRNKRQ